MAPYGVSPRPAGSPATQDIGEQSHQVRHVHRPRVVGPLEPEAAHRRDEQGRRRPDSPSATPVDAIPFAPAHGLPEVLGWDGPPDPVLPGIDHGPNAVSRIPYPGTVGVTSTAAATGEGKLRERVRFRSFPSRPADCPRS
ncbi:hypothetical protein SUDANB121_02322 [Nocardiopsis dassonvillei]